MFKKSKIKFTDKLIAATILKLFPSTIIPNHVTVFRFVTIPFIILFLSIERYDIALIIFIFAALSDAVDGAMARTRGLVTDWGKLYDSIADKLLIFSIAAIIVLKYLGWTIFIIMIIPDLLIVIGIHYKKHKTKKYAVEHNRAGKYKMVFQSIGVGLVMLYAILNVPFLIIASKYILYISVVLGFISFFFYKKFMDE